MKNCLYNTTALAIASLLVMVAPAAAYTIDGDCSDWGIYPKSDPVNSNRLDDSSLIPNPVGTIDYVIDNDNADWAVGAVRPNMSNFTGPEWCDIEAMYVDDSSTHIFVLIITSMPKNGMNWGYDHIQPGDLAFDFNNDDTFEYGVKIVQNDEPVNAKFGVVGAIYSNPTWAVLDPGTDRTDITSIVSGTNVGSATVSYTGTGGDEVSGVAVPDGPADSGLPWDTFGTTVYDGRTWWKDTPSELTVSNPPISNEIIEIKIPKSALGMPTTANIQSAITCGNGVIKLEAVTLIPEFVTLAIPVISLLGLVFFMRRKGQK
jgi:hypothetical protein